MNGRELSVRLVQQFSTLKVLFTSGYTQDVIARHGVLTPGTELLAKPYTSEALASRAHALLARVKSV